MRPARPLFHLSPPRPEIAMLLALAVHGTWLLASGVAIAPDTAGYDHWAGRLIATGFDIPGVAAEANSAFPPILYMLFVLVVAGLKLVFGAAWPQALAALNLAAGMGLAFLLVRLTAWVTGSGVAGWIALGLYLGCFGFAQWVPFALSDLTFCLIAFTIFTLAAARILGRAKGWGRVVALAAAGIFYRPTGIVLVPDLAWAAWLSRRDHKPAVAPVAAAAFCAALAAGIFLFAWLMQDPSRWPFATLAGAFRVVADGYAIGEVVSGRPETFHGAPSALIDFAALTADRFLHFFAPFASTYGTGHKLVELAFFLPCYGLGSWLLVALIRKDHGFGARETRVLLAAAGAILAYALFHALIQVDHDWRYRLPILPHLILLAAAGAADLMRRLERR